MIRLYHGSTVAVRKPSLRPGRPNADFGKGFHTTSVMEQAVRWAHIRQEREDAPRAVVSVYEFDESLLDNADWNIRRFTGADEPWLLRCVECRGRYPAAKGLQDLRPIVFSHSSGDRNIEVRGIV